MLGVDQLIAQHAAGGATPVVLVVVVLVGLARLSAMERVTMRAVGGV